MARNSLFALNGVKEEVFNDISDKTANIESLFSIARANSVI